MSCCPAEMANVVPLFQTDLVGRGRPSDPVTLAEFTDIDARDRGRGEPDTGQQVGDCAKLADFRIENDGTQGPAGPGVDPEQAAKIAIARRAKPGAPPGHVRLMLTLELRLALAEQLSAEAIRSGKNLEAIVIDMLEAGVKR